MYGYLCMSNYAPTRLSSGSVYFGAKRDREATGEGGPPHPDDTRIGALQPRLKAEIESTWLSNHSDHDGWGSYR